jgi:hypothetical protein
MLFPEPAKVEAFKELSACVGVGAVEPGADEVVEDVGVAAVTHGEEKPSSGENPAADTRADSADKLMVSEGYH